MQTLKKGMAIERPYFGPKQVRTLRGIKLGGHYDWAHNGEVFWRYLVVSEPWQDEDGDWWIDTIQWDEDEADWSGYIEPHCLADHGVVPYEGDIKNYNPVSALLRTGEKRMPLEEVEELKKTRRKSPLHISF